MSVGLGDLPADGTCPQAEVWATEYDADLLFIEQDGVEIALTRRQLQALSIIVDRFMDR